MNKKDFEESKVNIIEELARLEEMPWCENDEIAGTIFPYVLIEAINILKNSKIIENPIDYTSTGEDAKKMIQEILKK